LVLCVIGGRARVRLMGDVNMEISDFARMWERNCAARDFSHEGSEKADTSTRNTGDDNEHENGEDGQ